MRVSLRQNPQHFADLAAELYHLTVSQRRSRPDTMIAASPIPAGAELATVNPDDFILLVPHDVNLLLLS